MRAIIGFFLVTYAVFFGLRFIESKNIAKPIYFGPGYGSSADTNTIPVALWYSGLFTLAASAVVFLARRRSK